MKNGTYRALIFSKMISILQRAENHHLNCTELEPFKGLYTYLKNNNEKQHTVKIISSI